MGYKDLCASIKNFDIFGHPIEFSFRKKNFYQKSFGGFVSFLFISGFLIYSFITCYELFSLNTVRYFSRIKHQKIGGQGFLDLNTHNFMFSLKYTSEIWNNWEEPILPIKLHNSIQKRNISGIFNIENEIPLVNCTLEHFPGLENDFKELQLNETLCPQLGANFILQGGMDENLFRYIKISLFSCDKNNTQCLKNQNDDITTNNNLGKY